MAPNLAPIYLDNNRVRLQGDPRPKISKILEAGGKGKEATDQVMQLESQKADKGKVLRPEDTIDRTQHSEVAVYLKYVAKAEKAAAASSNMAPQKSAKEAPKSGRQESLRSPPSTGQQSTTEQVKPVSDKPAGDKQGAPKDVKKGRERFEPENVDAAEGDTVQAPKGAGEPGRSEQGKQAKQFGQQDTDVEQKSRDVTPRGRSQHITGMGQSQQSGEPVKVGKGPDQPEWKAATPDMARRHEKQGSRTSRGGKPSFTGPEESQPDIETFDQPDKQAEGSKGTDKPEEPVEGGKQGRGNRPARRREEPHKEAEGEEPVA